MKIIGGALKMDSRCEVYEATEIQKILKVSKTSVYKFLSDVYAKQSPFRVIKIGTLYRVPKHEFDKWLYGGENGTYE